MDDATKAAIYALYGLGALITERPWLSVPIALVVLLVAVGVRHRGGRYRVLFAAGFVWMLIGANEAVRRGVKPYESGLRAAELLLAPPAVYVLLGVGLLRARTAFDGFPRSAMSWAAGLVLIVAVCGSSAVGVAYLRDEAYPWTDNATPHATVHIVNESGQPVWFSWRYAHSDRWIGKRTSDLELAADQAGEHAHHSIMPLLSFIKQQSVVSEYGGTLPDDDYPIALRVQLDPEMEHVAVERAVVARPDWHFLIRIDENSDVSFAEGDEAWLGYPRFGDEVQFSDS